MPQDVSSQRRYHYVDLLRGLAAYAVLIGHYRWLYATVPDRSPLGVDLPFGSLLGPVYDSGSLAVRLFWALSGFVFVVAYGSNDVSSRTFWVHRIARLYPLHLITLVLVAILQSISLWLYGAPTIYPNNDLPHFLLQLFMASNWFTMEHSFNAPIWSVSAEVLIYFVFLLYLKRVGLSLAAAVGLTLAGGVIAVLAGSWVAQCMALFFAGVSIGIVAPEVHRRLGRWLLPLAASGLAAVALFCLGISSTGHGDFIPTFTIYIGCPALLCLFIAFDLRAPPLAARWHWIGLSTYSVYLWHMPIVIAVKLAWPGVVSILPNPLTLLGFVVLVGVVGHLSYRRIELPLQRSIRRTLLHERSKPATDRSRSQSAEAG
jgi:peptidoglycan/LPS O-acetylase OafA/YrhL